LNQQYFSITLQLEIVNFVEWKIKNAQSIFYSYEKINEL
jgi:hypothetical protein